VKNKIFEEGGIAVERTCIVYAGKTLENQRTLGDYNIRRESILNLIPTRHDSVMPIRLRTSTGKMITLEVAPQDTINDVKKEVYLKERILVECQSLFYAGEKLNDRKTLNDYNITRSSVLDLILKKSPEARLSLELKCEVISEPVQQERFSQMAAGSSTELPTTSRKRKADASWGLTTGQDALNLAMYKHLQTTDAEDVNGFEYYLVHVRKVVIVDVQPGSLIITVECDSLQKLEELWKDYCTGYVSKMAKKFLLTKEILSELGLLKVNLSTSIPREKYRACHELLQAFDRDLKQKSLELKTLRDEFQNRFRDWVSTRKVTRRLLKELETELSSFQRRREQREMERPRLSPWTALGFVGVTVAAVASAPVVALVGAGAAAAGFAGRIAEDIDGTEASISNKIAEVRLAIYADEIACQILKIRQNLFGSCVANFGVFCRDHIDLVLSSDLAEGEFSSLLYILRGIHSPGEAANAQVPLHVLVNKEVNIHNTRVSTLMEQFHWRSSSANQELSSITQQILHELQEGPNYDEIQTMITNFIEAKFSEACES